MFLADLTATLITLLIFVGFSVVNAWLRRRAESEQEQEPWSTPPPGKPPARRPMVPRSSGPAPPVLPPQPSTKPPQRKLVDWEEELRRLLGEEPSPSPPPPPPPLIPRTQEPSPPPIPPYVPEAPSFDEEELPAAPVSPFRESVQAYARASNLQQKVTDHLRQATEHPIAFPAVHTRRAAAPEVAEALRLLRRPRSARTAFVTSIILAPPRGLDLP